MFFPRVLLPLPVPGLCDPGPGLPRAADRLELRLGFIELYELNGPFLGLFLYGSEVTAWLKRSGRRDHIYRVVCRVPAYPAMTLEPARQVMYAIGSDGTIWHYPSKYPKDPPP
jgi:hypothetical protein